MSAAVRARLVDLAHLPRDFTRAGSISPEGCWVARALVAQWPPRRPPSVVVLRRLEGVDDAQWGRVFEQLRLAAAELAERDVPIAVTFAERELLVHLAGAGQQTLFAAAAA
jgi:hypothetical protein